MFPRETIHLSSGGLGDNLSAMRVIGYLENEQVAQHFGDFLYVRGMENTINEDESKWAIWVHDDDHLKEAGEWLAKYRANPLAPEFTAANEAGKKREDEEKDHTAFQKRMHGREKFVGRSGLYGMGKLTVSLMAISIIVSLLSGLGRNENSVMALFITKWSVAGGYLEWLRGLPEIRSGQVWRLFTPMFIHFGIMHIVFNMLWLRDLGSMIERKESSWKLLLLVLVTSGGSNLAQYSISIPALPTLGGGAPNFGGMSGVVYGLLGYIWIRGKLDPFSGFHLHQSTVTMMLIWLVLCFTGLLGPIANLAHLFGLLIGMGMGYLSSQIHFKKS